MGEFSLKDTRSPDTTQLCLCHLYDKEKGQYKKDVSLC